MDSATNLYTGWPINMEIVSIMLDKASGRTNCMKVKEPPIVKKVHMHILYGFYLTEAELFRLI